MISRYWKSQNNGTFASRGSTKNTCLQNIENHELLRPEGRFQHTCLVEKVKVLYPEGRFRHTCLQKSREVKLLPQMADSSILAIKTVQTESQIVAWRADSRILVSKLVIKLAKKVKRLPPGGQIPEYLLAKVSNKYNCCPRWWIPEYLLANSQQTQQKQTPAYTF